MEAKRKVSFTVETKGKETFTFLTDKNDPGEIKKIVIARRILRDAVTSNEKMAHWAKDLNVSRQYVCQVVHGSRRGEKVREYIEKRMNRKYWD